MKPWIDRPKSEVMAIKRLTGLNRAVSYSGSEGRNKICELEDTWAVYKIPS